MNTPAMNQTAANQPVVNHVKFFEGRRPQFYFHGGRLKKDAKTDKIFWHLNLVITCDPEDMAHCEGLILNNYISIETLDNHVGELGIDLDIVGEEVEFFAAKENKKCNLKLTPCDLAGIRFTRVERLTELWVMLAVQQSEEVHRFVKEYIFTRLWAEFKPVQARLL